MGALTFSRTASLSGGVLRESNPGQVGSQNVGVRHVRTEEPIDRQAGAAKDQSLFREIVERMNDVHDGFTIVMPVGEWMNAQVWADGDVDDCDRTTRLLAARTSIALYVLNCPPIGGYSFGAGAPYRGTGDRESCQGWPHTATRLGGAQRPTGLSYSVQRPGFRPGRFAAREGGRRELEGGLSFSSRSAALRRRERVIPRACRGEESLGERRQVRAHPHEPSCAAGTRSWPHLLGDDEVDLVCLRAAEHLLERLVDSLREPRRVAAASTCECVRHSSGSVATCDSRSKMSSR